MTHQLINTGAGWRCLRCKVAWDQGEDAPETCEAGDEYGFVTDLPTVDQMMDGSASATQKVSFWNDLQKRFDTGGIVPGEQPPQPDLPGERRYPQANTMAVQIGGAHYKTLAIQPTEFCMRNGLDFCVGSILKYLTRWRSKNGIEDLRKGRHFVEIREAFKLDIQPPRQIAITMLEYVTRNNIRPDDAEALYRLEAYYNAVGHHARIGADRLISEIDRLIARAG